MYPYFVYAFLICFSIFLVNLYFMKFYTYSMCLLYRGYIIIFLLYAPCAGNIRQGTVENASLIIIIIIIIIIILSSTKSAVYFSAQLSPYTHLPKIPAVLFTMNLACHFTHLSSVMFPCLYKPGH